MGDQKAMEKLKSSITFTQKNAIKFKRIHCS